MRPGHAFIFIAMATIVGLNNFQAIGLQDQSAPHIQPADLPPTVNLQKLAVEEVTAKSASNSNPDAERFAALRQSPILDSKKILEPIEKLLEDLAADAVAEQSELKKQLWDLSGMINAHLANKKEVWQAIINDMEAREPTVAERKALLNVLIDYSVFDEVRDKVAGMLILPDENFRAEIKNGLDALKTTIKNLENGAATLPNGQSERIETSPGIHSGKSQTGSSGTDSGSSAVHPVPFKKLNAFSATPSPHAIPDQNALDRMRSLSDDRAGNEIPFAKNRRDEKHHVFNNAATFNVMGFDNLGEAYVERQAIIYEGMRVSIAKDGQYEVQFLIETPAMPVTLRLQLVVSGTGGSSLSLPPNSGNVTFEPELCPGSISLTLPMIVIEPRSVSPDRPGVYEIRHRGYSAALQSLVDSDSKRKASCCLWDLAFGLSLDKPEFDVSRSGSATMGFPSTKYVDDYYAERIIRPQLANPYATAARNKTETKNN